MRAARFVAAVGAVSGMLAALACDGIGPARGDWATATTAHSTNAASPADTSAINKRVASIEHYADTHPDHVELFASVPGRASLVPVRDTTAWPDSIDTSYDLVRDSTGRPIKYYASPFIESGDEDIEISYWFDAMGRTIKYEYYESSFNSECAEILRETKHVWLNDRGMPIASTMGYTDENYKPVRPERCIRRADSVPPPRLRAADLAVPPARTADTASRWSARTGHGASSDKE